MPDMFGNLTQEEREMVAKKRQEMLDNQAKVGGPDEGEKPAPATPPATPPANRTGR